jgi:ADP-L-glycero-D-manno-heptose 6-epimerase
MESKAGITDSIIITGAAGFIGSCLVGSLNQLGFENLILVDEFSRQDKLPNLEQKRFRIKIDREDFFQSAVVASSKPAFCFHIGARTDTTEFDYSIHQRLNVDYSKKIWEFCKHHQIPLVYASSAATYGDGEFGYEDSHSILSSLKPLNAYGISKNEFDKWAIAQQSLDSPPFWAGLKFFNVYGPNEYHKGRMASVIFHAANQIKKTGVVRLFKSYRPDFKDGWQLRDFIYVKDVLKVCYWLMDAMIHSRWLKINNGIYNLGTGHARSFEDLAKATFAGLSKAIRIDFIDMPQDIRDKYQYFTEARMDKLKAVGYHDAFYSLEKGVADYVQHYLAVDAYY